MATGSGEISRLLVRRLISGTIAVWAVMTATFGLFALTDDWVLQGEIGALKWAGATQSEVQAARRQYFAARGLDRPLFERYVDWLGDMLTLNWGQSWETGDAVLSTVLGAAGRTLLYVLPAVVLAITIGLLVALAVALSDGSRSSRLSLGTVYVLFALPNFWVGGLLFSLVVGGYVDHATLVYEHALPILLVTTTLLGGYVSYARAYAIKQVRADFVKLVRAKGAGWRRTAWHVLHNAAIPVVSMLFTEALGLLVLAVFVIESVFGIDGFGLLLVEAIDRRDLPVVLGGTTLLVVTGIIANTLQDLSYYALDPRVDTESR